jgi:hypothetical protein
MPNDEKIQSCNTAKLNLPALKDRARKSHFFGDLNNNLLSVGQLYDAGYNVRFDKHKATVHNNAEIFLTAKCGHSHGLWRSPLTDNIAKTNNIETTAHCNNAQIHVMSTKCYLQRHTKNDKSPTVCSNNVQDYTNIKDAISYLQGATSKQHSYK